MRKRRAALSLAETLIALGVFLAMVWMAATLLPATAGLNRASADYAVAQNLVAGKRAQLLELGYYGMNGPALGQSGKGLVDGTPATPTSAQNAGGSRSATFEFTQTDGLVAYFSGAAVSAIAPRGFVYLAPYDPSAQVVSGSTVYGFIRATVTVQWRTTRGQLRSFSQTTLIPRVKLQ